MYGLKIKSSKIYLYAVLFLAALGVIFSISFILNNQKPAEAANLGQMTFSEFAIHPYASQSGFDKTSKNYYNGQFFCTDGRDFCPRGQRISDINIDSNGTLVAGYGDWNDNTDSFGVEAGRVGVVPLNVHTKEWSQVNYFLGSEAIEGVRIFNDKFYVATTDPSDKNAYQQNRNNYAGYLTNETGEWKFVRVPDSIHLFDVWVDGNDRYAVGSKTYYQPDGTRTGTAVIYKSTDAGQNWSVLVEGAHNGDFARYYAVGVKDGKVYTDKAVFNKDSGAPIIGENGLSGNYGNIDLHDNQIYGPRALVRDNGPRISTSVSGVSITSISRIKTYDDGVYGLQQSRNTLAKRDFSENSYTEIVSMDTGSYTNCNSFAIFEDYVYRGCDNGVIIKSNQTITAAIAAANPPTPPIAEASQPVLYNGIPAGCFEFYGLDDPLATEIYLTQYLPYPDMDRTKPQCPKDVNIPSEVNGKKVTIINSHAFNFLMRSQGWPRFIKEDAEFKINSVVIPEGITHIGESAFFANNLKEINLPKSLEYAYDADQDGQDEIYINALDSAFMSNQIEKFDFKYNFYTSTPDWNQNLSYNNIKELNIADGVTYIASDFIGNSLKELRVPDSVTRLGYFHENHIERVYLGAGIKSLENESYGFENQFAGKFNSNGGVYGGFNIRTAENAAVSGTSILTQIFTKDPSNPDKISDNVICENMSSYLAPPLGNENPEAPFRCRGYIINPAQLQLQYVNESGVSVKQSITVSGEKADGAYLQGYTPTEDGFTTPDQVSAAYYRIGQAITITPPEIEGYITPAPFTVILGGEMNLQKIVYVKKASDVADQPEIKVVEQVPLNNLETPNTGVATNNGVNLAWIIGGFVAGFAVIFSLIWFLFIRKKRQ